MLPPKGCALLITSRLRFSLPGMIGIDLEVLTEAEAVRLLHSLCTRLSEADARRLAHSCGYLPLALRVSGSLLHNDPALEAVSYLQHLADERQRLALLHDPDDPAGGQKALLALTQFDIERAHIDAAHGWAQRTAETPEGDQLLIDSAQASRHIEHLRYDPRQESIPLWERVRTAARRLGDQTEEGRALGHLGGAYFLLGELHTATFYNKQSLVIACELGNLPSQAAAL